MPYKTISAIGTNLFAIAALEFGDATAWSVIAAANDLLDPEITSLTTLVIPDRSSQTS